MCACLFLCPLKHVVRVSSPASLSLAPASSIPLRGLQLTCPYLPSCMLYYAVDFLAWPAPIPGPALLQISALVKHAPGPLCRSRHRSPRRALGSSPPLGRSASDLLCSKRLCSRGFPHYGPRPFEALCALVTPDSLNAIARDQCVVFVNKLCCCSCTLPS